MNLKHEIAGRQKKKENSNLRIFEHSKFCSYASEREAFTFSKFVIMQFLLFWDIITKKKKMFFFFLKMKHIYLYMYSIYSTFNNLLN